PQGREVFRRKFTSLKSTSLSLAHLMTGLSLSSGISAAAVTSARTTVSCALARCCSHTLTSSSTSTVRLPSRRSTAISMISVSPIAGAMETGDTCGRMRASRAESSPPNGLYRCGLGHKARRCRLGVEFELAKREKELLWLRPSEAEPELTKSREASITGAPGQDTIHSMPL